MSFAVKPQPGIKNPTIRGQRKLEMLPPLSIPLTKKERWMIGGDRVESTSPAPEKCVLI
jgi:hypothetical protein